MIHRKRRLEAFREREASIVNVKKVMIYKFEGEKWSVSGLVLLPVRERAIISIIEQDQ